MPRVGKKQSVEESVLDAARRRISQAFDRFDRLAVAFSGGKDSTVVLNLVAEEAERRGKLPIDAFFFDEECIEPPTHDYVKRVFDNPERVRLKWMLLPVQHRNGCSATEPYWYPWDVKCPELWVRERPSWGIGPEDLPGWKDGMTTLDVNHLMYPGKGSLGIFLGVRADESMSRYRGIAMRKVDVWITKRDHDYLLKPIYDWTTGDVWRAPKVFGWDFNRCYDLFDMLGITLSQQRVAPPFGEQPMRGLAMWGELWPERWDKMSMRVPGAATAARLARTMCYGYGGGMSKPEGGWQKWTAEKLKQYDLENRKRLLAKIKDTVRAHGRMTKDPMPDDEPHPVSGACWKTIARVVLRGDFKNRELLRKDTDAGVKFTQSLDATREKVEKAKAKKA